MRWTTAAAVAATTVIGAGTAAVAAGRHVSDLSLKPSVDGPGTAGPLTVHWADDERVALTRTVESLRPGRYGLTGRGVHAAVGELLSTAGDTVTRRLERVQRGLLRPGTEVRITPQVYAGDPGGTLGLDFENVAVAGELGPMPAWLVPAPRDVWVITVHGLGTTREHPMVVMPALNRLRLPVLDISCRNDPGAPRTADRISHLGEAEWRDVDAAIRHAVDHGARRVVLYGWSVGATAVLHAAERSPLRERVAGTVLDSPVLDWRAALRATARGHGVSGALVALGVRAAQGRAGLDAGPPALPRPAVPALLVHGPDDRIAPFETSRRLAELYPDLISVRTVPRAGHQCMWNADPEAYETTLRRFLTPLL
ncbi:hypothetical protein GQS52_21785 [Streptomyces sp. SCUT-3]|uniref:alpha/beta hydrolase family protein n=1 Tax=Streptomyces sp. SCUT-3 TaxID=2684469 RepID=UPI0015F8EC71|nr:hypothetical protein [Streptomyces sp. SCUT-3]QMV25276.1 hypothetical protein GQS52_21785 [Streptomyces sp. SCUT-3]